MENINKETSASVSGNATAQAGVKNEPKKNGYRKNYHRNNMNGDNSKNNTQERNETRKFNNQTKTTDTQNMANVKNEKENNNESGSNKSVRTNRNNNYRRRNMSQAKHDEPVKTQNSKSTVAQNVSNTKLDTAISNALNFGFKKSNLKIIALGGLDEIGKNITVFEYENEIILVDCGLEFPDEDMLGVDLVIPYVTYLIKNKEKIKASFITHCHEDHIGSIP